MKTKSQISCDNERDIVELRRWMKKVCGFNSHLSAAVFTGLN